MGAPSKRARKVRSSSEFDVRRLAAEVRPPNLSPSAYSWLLPDIVAARDAQMRGQFKLPARLAESMRTDDAIFVARSNRLAPQKSLEVSLEPGKGARALPIAREAEALFGADALGVAPETLADIHGCLIDHEIAFACAVAKPRDDGSRVDYSLRAWPIEWVRWDSIACTFKTQTADGPEEPIVHGDGRWIIFSKHELEPFKHGALLPAALVWARHAFAIRDWAKGSTSHGNAKVVGEMPSGMALQSADGALTAEAASFLELLKAMASSDAPAGIRPAGSKTEYVTNTSTAWQVWNELAQNAEKAAARIYLGTDGTLGAQGGAPGVDIQALFGVAAALVEGDLECLERGLKTGLIDPWCAINFGDSSLAPTRRYVRPDPDAEALHKSLAERSAAFYADLKGARDAGIPLSQEFVDALADDYQVRAPRIAVATPPTAAPARALSKAATALRLSSAQKS